MPFRVSSGTHTMCAPVVLVGGVIGHLFKIAGRGLVRLVVCTQGPVAQEQRDREHQRQGAPNLPAGTHSSETKDRPLAP